ncbi:hypothetical protein KA119_01305 [Candidatus Gracilibacteria bacterium]|nr:hypothetical protein [Candidatus Gracilibacteria bacterium]
MTTQVDAAAISNVNDQGDVSVLRCAQTGSIEFGLFVDSALYKEKFTDLFEPVWDITNRNQCHSIDISALMKQQDALRRQIRTAFMTCNTQNMSELRKGYYKLTAEIFYVRNVVKGGIIFSVPLNLIEERIGPNALLTSKDVLFQGMRDRYLDEMTEGELGDLYLALESKYQNRVKDYMRCEGDGFNEVAKKWNDFQEHFTEDYAGLKQALPGIQAEALELAEEVKTIKTVEYFAGDKVSLSDYAESWVSLQVNGVAPTKAVMDIVKEIQENFPDASISTMTHYEIVNRLVHEEETFDTRTLEAEMRANFDLLYGSGSESSELFVDHLDGRDTAEVVGLLEVLDSSVGALAAIDDGLNDINLRQCVSRGLKGDLRRQLRSSLVTVLSHTTPAVASCFLAAHPFNHLLIVQWTRKNPAEGNHWGFWLF